VNSAYGRFGQYGQLPVLFSQRARGFGPWGAAEEEGPDTMKMVGDIVGIAKGLFGPKSSYQLEAQLATAKAQRKSATTIRELEAELKAARDRERQGDTWRFLGGLAIIGVVGLAAAGSYALIARANR
jgi:hypothetical protein